MRGGLLLLLSGAALAGCASGPGQVQVRALADPAAKLGTGSERLAEARGQLLLGNVGLAIEGFHAALREQPDNIEAMRGLAACYDSMGRTDLSRQYYEAALAVAPHNPTSLNALASSLEAQGKPVQAAEVRGEAAQATAQRAPAAAPITVAMIARPLAPVVAAAVAPVFAPALAAAPLLSAAEPVTAAPPVTAVPSVTTAPAVAQAPAVLTAEAIAAVPPQTPVAIVHGGESVTIALSPPRPVAAPIVRASVHVPGPRLQRLSRGEVALLTAGEPAWQPTVAIRTAQSTTVRWVALNDGPSRPNVRLLNAARSQGLAARTRSYLLARGWRNIEIGDADEVRRSTLVMYPAGRQATGRSLAAQFSVRAGTLQQGQVLVVLLGRDAAVSKVVQARG